MFIFHLNKGSVMNMPRTEFLCGMPQETPPDWRLTYRHQIYLFERHREREPMRDLVFLVARWLHKKQHLPQDIGFIHRVQYPEQPEMEILAWTAYQAFQMSEPSDGLPAPTRLVFFGDQSKLLSWKRDYWKEHQLPLNACFAVHANCFDPNGQRIQTGRLLTFNG